MKHMCTEVERHCSGRSHDSWQYQMQSVEQICLISDFFLEQMIYLDLEMFLLTLNWLLVEGESDQLIHSLEEMMVEMMLRVDG